MESFLKNVLTNKGNEYTHRYFVRFGKGQYNRRFLISLDRGASKIKIRASFELANDIVNFVNEINKNLKFSGKILIKDKVSGLEGKKKAGFFVYEISESSIEQFENAYYYLLDVNHSEIILKIKKSLPKPGKAEKKIDDKFCALDLDLKYLPQVKETFFWDVPDCKKAKIEHDVIIKEIEFPKNEKDPVKVRELAKRIGKIVRRINFDGKDTAKEYAIAA